MNKCSQIQMYINDIVDDTADDDIRLSFFSHIKECDICRRKYEISLRMRDILAGYKCEPDKTLTADVMVEVRGISRRTGISDKVSEKHFLRNLVISICALIVAGLSIFFMFHSSDTDNNILSDIEQPAQPQKLPVIINAENNNEYLTSDFFNGYLDKGDSRLFTVSSLTSALVSKDFNIGSGKYDYIMLVKVKNFDIVNMNYDITYITSSNKDGYAFFCTDMKADDVIAKFDMVNEIFVISGTQAAGRGLIIAKLVTE